MSRCLASMCVCVCVCVCKCAHALCGLYTKLQLVHLYSKKCSRSITFGYRTAEIRSSNVSFSPCTCMYVCTWILYYTNLFNVTVGN